MNQRIPVTVVTGFLGSGKTTLLSGLLRSAQAQRFAVLVNEFGEASIDDLLLGRSSGSRAVEIHSLNSGLVAYSNDELFLPTMQALSERRDLIDHVLIETSGLALPTAVLARLEGSTLADDFVLDATVVVVDAPLLLSGGFAASAPVAYGLPAESASASIADLFQRQLENSDVVVLNKIDTLTEEDLLQCESRLRRLAPSVRFIELAFQARLDPRLVLGVRLNQPTYAEHAIRQAKVPVTASAGLTAGWSQAVNGHAHQGLGAHEHGIFTHEHLHEGDPGWLSFVLRTDEAQAADLLLSALQEAASAEPLLRCKGFASVAGSQQKLLVQGVRQRIALTWADAALEPDNQDDGNEHHEHHAHDHHEHHAHDHHAHEHHEHHEHSDRTAGLDANEQGGSQLVFIGYHLSRANVAALLSRITGTSWK